MKIAAIAILFAGSLGGCAETTMVSVVNPATGQFAQCEVAATDNGWAIGSALARFSSSRACPRDVATAGWVEVR